MAKTKPPDPRHAALIANAASKKKQSGGGTDIKIVAPPVSSGTANKEQKFAAWATKNGVPAATVNDIWYWSNHTPNVDPYLWTSVLLAESGAKHLKGNGQLVSSGQAVGIGQVALSWIGQPIPWDKAEKFTADNNPRTGIGNYGVNLRMSATLWGGGVAAYGWKQAYLQSYNPNDPNKAVTWAKIEKTYNSRPAGNPPIGSPSQGPADTTPTSQTGGSPYPAPFTDPYVTGINKQNKFSLTNDANKALQFDGRPLTRSAFLTLKDQLTSYYVSYTGKRPSNPQILQFVTKSWSTYTLTDLLSKGPNFTKSPIYKEYAGNWNNDPNIKNVLGTNGKVPEDLARQAILNQWTSQTVAEKLRKTTTYIQSNEFKGNVAAMLNIHSSIMGTPDNQGMIDVKDAALAGWTPDQYAAWLRSQSSYTSSTEYQSKALTFLDALGLITGAQTVLQPGVNPGPGTVQPKTQGILPSDPRITGKAAPVAPPINLGATLA